MPGYSYARMALVAASVLALVLVASGLAGCDLTGVKSGSGTSATPASPAPTGTGSGDAAAVEQIAVPDVLGKYYDDAAAAIRYAGLAPVDISVHGPIDDDAGEMGLIYRQTPNAGEKVARGTKVELRSWWESQ